MAESGKETRTTQSGSSSPLWVSRDQALTNWYLAGEKDPGFLGWASVFHVVLGVHVVDGEVPDPRSVATACSPSSPAHQPAASSTGSCHGL